MSKLLAMMMKPKNYMYATIKGSLTENNGVFSGFSGSNYLALQNNINLSTNFEIKIKFTPSSETTGSKKFLSLFYTNSIYLDFYTSGATPRIDCQYSGGSYWSQIASNLSYDIPIIITIRGNGTTLNVEVNQNNNSQSGSKTLQELGIENITTNNIYFGKGHTTSLPMIDGSIDLNQSYIKIQNTKYQLQAVVGYTVVGSPTIVDGVVSGFGSSDYLNISKSINPVSENIKTIELFSKITTGNTISASGILCSGSYGNGALGFVVASSRPTLMIYYYNGTANKNFQCNSSIILQPNTTYYLKGYIDIQTGKCKIQVSTDGINYTLATKTPTNFVSIVNHSYTYHIGQAQNGVFIGSIDLNETYIKINNKLWFNGQPA